jgi:hypothetical protein
MSEEHPDPTTPSAQGSPDARSAAPPTDATPTVRLEGMPDLRFVGAAGKFFVANLRMVLVRNALIALAVVVAAVAVVTVGVREAYRPTLTIAAFDVPQSLAERGLSGRWWPRRCSTNSSAAANSSPRWTRAT